MNWTEDKEFEQWVRNLFYKNMHEDNWKCTMFDAGRKGVIVDSREYARFKEAHKSCEKMYMAWNEGKKRAEPRHVMRVNPGRKWTADKEFVSWAKERFKGVASHGRFDEWVREDQGADTDVFFVAVRDEEYWICQDMYEGWREAKEYAPDETYSTLKTPDNMWTTNGEFVSWAKKRLPILSDKLRLWVDTDKFAVLSLPSLERGDSYWFFQYVFENWKPCEGAEESPAPPEPSHTSESTPKFLPMSEALKDGTEVYIVISGRFDTSQSYSGSDVWVDSDGDQILIDNCVVGWLPIPEDPKEFYIIYETLQGDRGALSVSFNSRKNRTTGEERALLRRTMDMFYRHTELRECTKKEADEWVAGGG